MKTFKKAALGALAMSLSAAVAADSLPANQTESAWFTDAQMKLMSKLEAQKLTKAKNVITKLPTNIKTHKAISMNCAGYLHTNW